MRSPDRCAIAFIKSARIVGQQPVQACPLIADKST